MDHGTQLDINCALSALENQNFELAILLLRDRLDMLGDGSVKQLVDDMLKVAARAANLGDPMPELVETLPKLRQSIGALTDDLA